MTDTNPGMNPNRQQEEDHPWTLLLPAGIFKLIEVTAQTASGTVCATSAPGRHGAVMSYLRMKI